jgi:hypothetical protein
MWTTGARALVDGLRRIVRAAQLQSIPHRTPATVCSGSRCVRRGDSMLTATGIVDAWPADTLAAVLPALGQLRALGGRCNRVEGRRRPAPNALLRAARERLASPTGSGRRMSRQELAEAVNAWLWQTYQINERLDENLIGKLERGEHRWPGKLRREAFRAVLGVTMDRDLGFHIVRGQGTATASPGTPPVADTDAARLVYVQEAPRSPEEMSTPDVSLVRRTGAAWFGMLPDDLVDLPGPWTTDLEVPARIEVPHVEALRRSIALFEQWDHQYGGGLARAAIRGQLQWVCRAARQSVMSDAVRRMWQSTAARLGDLAGWACFDAGERFNVAQLYYLTAIELAGEVADIQQRTHTATSMSRHLTYLGRTTDALEISGLARLGWRELPPLGRAVIGIVEARTHAKIGDSRACRQAVDLCDEQFAASPPDAADDPTWGYYADPGQILGDAGHALFDLAMTSGDEIQAEATVNRLEAAYATHQPDTKRSKALTMIRIACLRARHHDLTEALDAAEVALADARQVHSHRVVDDLRLLDAVLGRAGTDPAARDRLATVRRDIAGLVDIGA